MHHDSGIREVSTHAALPGHGPLVSGKRIGLITRSVDARVTAVELLAAHAELRVAGESPAELAAMARHDPQLLLIDAQLSFATLDRRIAADPRLRWSSRVLAPFFPGSASDGFLQAVAESVVPEQPLEHALSVSGGVAVPVSLLHLGVFRLLRVLDALGGTWTLREKEAGPVALEVHGGALGWCGESPLGRWTQQTPLALWVAAAEHSKRPLCASIRELLQSDSEAQPLAS